MDDLGKDQPASAPGEEDSGRSWLPMAIGTALVAAVVLAFIIAGRSGPPASTQADPYLANLQMTGLHMSTAENFAGGSVTYIEGTITNAGDKKVTGARVQVVFRNSLGEITQKDTLPVLVVLPNMPYVDYGTMDRAPLAAGQARGFRLILEHVTADWDGQIPQVKVVAASY